MSIPKKHIKQIVWGALSAICGITLLVGPLFPAFFEILLDAPFAFMQLMFPGLDEKSLWFLPYAVCSLGVIGCVGFAYLAAGGRMKAGIVCTAILAVCTGLHELYLIPVTAVIGGGCLIAIAVYRFLAKQFPMLFNRETISYIVFGVLTTVVSFVSQMLFASLGTPVWINTIGSWVCAVVFAYVVNKLFVFESHTDTMKAFWREMWLFFAARLASLGMELVFMVVTVDFLGFSEAICKLIAQVFILIANYIFSKLIIFRKKED